jgi:hypothetical protein
LANHYNECNNHVDELLQNIMRSEKKMLNKNIIFKILEKSIFIKYNNKKKNKNLKIAKSTLKLNIETPYFF